MTNPLRSFEWDDLLADGLGAALALVLYRSQSWYRNFLEWPLWGGRPVPPAPAEPQASHRLSPRKS